MACALITVLSRGVNNPFDGRAVPFSVATYDNWWAHQNHQRNHSPHHKTIA